MREFFHFGYNRQTYRKVGTESRGSRGSLPRTIETAGLLLDDSKVARLFVFYA